MRDTAVRVGVLRHAALRHAVLATLVLGCVTAVVVVVATAVVPAGNPVAVDPQPGFAGWAPPPVDAAGGELAGSGLVRSDALWYLAIAADGYPTTEVVPQAAAFLPGYPAVVATVAAVLGGRLVLAAHLVSLLATVAALVGLHRLAELVGGAELPRRTVLLAAVFPTAFFLLAPYAESLLLASATWALVEAARGRPWRAAALAAVATLVRPVGVLLAVPLLLGVVAGRGARTGLPALQRNGDGDGRRRWADGLVPTLGVGLGGVGLLVHGWIGWGDPLAVVTAQAGWQRTSMLPWVALWDATRIGLRTLVDGSAPYHLLDLLVFGLTAWGVVVLARRRQWPLVAHAVVSILLWLSQPFAGRPLMSTPRFALAVPGVVLGLALASEHPGVRRALPPVAAVLFALHLALFTRWLFVF